MATLLTFYLNNRVFLSRNYRLIVALRKFDVLKTNICPRSEASKILRLKPRKPNIKFEKENRQKPRIQFQLFIFYETRLFTEKLSRTTTIHPGIFGGRALSADSDSGPPRMNTIAPRDQFKPIRMEKI